ncbi:hypothetical protein ACFOOK_13900 [Micromonospora krabiensis]|uniref:Uncharacterized protein n=1 Tax=Micromonospora krabiensis TaxID=307121 RepID=A0A1C3N1K4_9ACTN|nr:hypothetical protein [Micromonospora krabiensis]SBV26472.1 hypothetical protein GA0070620_1961 [Micromonospora krabiensis]
MKRRPGQYVGGVGTACLAVGATIFVLTLATKAYGGEVLLAGALLVIVGLLLRIEAAVWAGRQDGKAP